MQQDAVYMQSACRPGVAMRPYSAGDRISSHGAPPSRPRGAVACPAAPLPAVVAKSQGRIGLKIPIEQCD